MNRKLLLLPFLVACSKDPVNEEVAMDLAAPPNRADLAPAADLASDCRAPAPENRVRRVVISLPYDDDAMRAEVYGVLPLAEDGTLGAVTARFKMGRAFGGPIRFTPDGSLGFVAQEDGTVGVFRLAPDGTPQVVDAHYKGGGYATRVALDPAGDRLYVLNGNTRANGGGITLVGVACDGTLTPYSKAAAGSLPYALLPLGQGRAVAYARELLDSAAGDDAHLVETGPPLARKASAPSFGDSEAIVASAGLTTDHRYALFGDNSEFSGPGDRVAVVAIEADALRPTRGRLLVCPIMNPRAYRARQRAAPGGLDLNRCFPGDADAPEIRMTGTIDGDRMSLTESPSADGETDDITAEDLASYRVRVREPLTLRYRDATIITNPPPSAGGSLIAFGLRLLARVPLPGPGFASPEHLALLARVLARTVDARAAHSNLEQLLAEQVLDEHGAALLAELAAARAAHRGTTHISVIDRDGNAASVTLSNGEGCGSLIPGTGVMLNNMLGEDDVNPAGPHAWPLDVRLSSMMSPTAIVRDDGWFAVTGSGGSKRIRSAILQVVSNLIDFAMPLREAIGAQRMHADAGQLNLEGGFADGTEAAMNPLFPRVIAWQGRNMYFGGCHTVARAPDGSLDGAGDPRRDGVCLGAAPT